jgi:Group 4 capsule polysaccharide lipoprotein gfcB, YjbF
MGTVLAMSDVNAVRMSLNVAVISAIVLLSGCGELAKSGVGPRIIATLVPSMAQDVAAPNAALDFSPQTIAANTSQFQIFTINALTVQAPGRLIQDNGIDQTWASQSGFTASYRDGLLVATRGLGDDLMASDTGQVRAVLAQGGGQAERAVDFLDDFDRIETVRFACEIAAQGREVVDLGLRQPELAKYEETCSSPTLVFTNIYWLDDAGEILQSRQFVSQTVAYLRSNRL